MLKLLSLWWTQVSYPLSNFTGDPHYSEGWKSGYFSIWPSLQFKFFGRSKGAGFEEGSWAPRHPEVSSKSFYNSLHLQFEFTFRSMFGWLGSVWSSLLFDKLNVYQHIFFELYPLFLGSVATVWPLFLVHPWSTTRYIPQIKGDSESKTYNRRKFSWETSGLRRSGACGLKRFLGQKAH